MKRLIGIYGEYQQLNLFKKVGKNVNIGRYGYFTNNTISLGNDAFIGQRVLLVASESKINIGNKVMFSANVTIMGGDHNSSVIGSYMYDVKVKRTEDDIDVIIKDDVWVGTGVIILKGVTVGRGSIIAAGSLVIKDVQPYSIVGGVPAKQLKMRFTEKEIELHEEKLRK